MSNKQETERVIRPEPAVMSRLLSLHNAVGGLAATTPDILSHPEVAKAIEQELAQALIACLTALRQQRGVSLSGRKLCSDSSK